MPGSSSGKSRSRSSSSNSSSEGGDGGRSLSSNNSTGKKFAPVEVYSDSRRRNDRSDSRSNNFKNVRNWELWG